MAQKLVYVDKNQTQTVEWLNALHASYTYTNANHPFYHSVVFTNDNYIITHGKIYNGHDTITSSSDLENLGLYTVSGKINNVSKTFYVDNNTSSAGLSDIYAPTTAGTANYLAVSAGAGKAPVWKSLKALFDAVTGTTGTSGQILKYNGSALAWAADDNTTYKLKINTTTNGDSSNGVNLGTVYAPTSAGTSGLILQANSSGIPAWVTLSTSIASNLTSSDKTIPTSYAVYLAIEAAKTQAMVYKGTVASYSALPSNASNGDVYKFTSDDTTHGYKTGDLAVAKVTNNTLTWDQVPSGDETETFITVKTSATSDPVTNYNKASGEVTLGNAALAYTLSGNISGNTTKTNLVSAKQVADYISGLNYSTTVGTVTEITTGVGLTGGPITSTGEIKAKLSSETALSGATVYNVGVDGSGYLAVNVPWTNTTYSYFVGKTGATANAAVTTGTDIYLTSKASSSSSASNMLGLHAGTGISIASNNARLVTITNTSPNITTTLYVGASGAKANAATTNGSTYLKLYEGNTAGNSFKISGSGAASVASDSNGNITITGVNTWRPVFAYDLTNTRLNGNSPALSNSTGTAALAFGSEFVYTEGDSELNANDVSEIHLAWAEVASDGTVTYAI